MHRMLLFMRTNWESEESHENLYRKEILHMYRMWLFMCTIWACEKTDERKTLQNTECDYSCVQVGNLNSHKRIYTGNKHYTCTECDCSCIQVGHRKKHMKIHAGEKPYKCIECDYSCVQAEIWRVKWEFIQERKITNE